MSSSAKERVRVAQSGRRFGPTEIFSDRTAKNAFVRPGGVAHLEARRRPVVQSRHVDAGARG